MTVMIAPAVPATPEPAPQFESRSQLDRNTTFGPALSEAQDRLTSSDAGRSDFAEHTARRSKRSEPRTSTPSSGQTDDAAPEEPSSDEATNETASTEPSGDVVDEAGADTSSTTSADVSLTPNAAPVSIATIDLPTAKGAVGGGDSSTEPTVEEVAPPEVLETIADVDATVIDDGVTTVDLEALTAPEGETVDALVGQMAREAALTSLEQVTDSKLELADRIRPATTEQVAGPSLLSEEVTRAEALGGLQSADGEVDASLQGQVEEAVTEGEPAANADAETAAGEQTDTTPDQVDVEPDVGAADRSAQKATVNPTNQTDTPDAVVVLAREATGAVDAAAKPTSAASAQTAGASALPAGAEANLWEDVRGAFDRIRSTGDGQEVRIRLRPAELGELIVQVRTQGDHVAVRLVASSAAAQQTLVDDRLRLAAELARAGFDEGSVDIGQQNTGDSGRQDRPSEGGEGSDAQRQTIGTANGLDQVGATREIFERRDPIRTDIGFRPGRTAYSTINLTL